MADLPLIPLSNRTIIAVGGDDRISFLQGLVTNDVTNLEGKAVWSALLTAQGKYLHDFIILADGDRLLLDVEAGRRDDLIRRLRMFRLRAKVDLTDLTGQFAIFARLDAAQAERGTVTRVEGGWQIVDPRQAGLGHRLILPVNTVATGDFADWDRTRMTLGIPDGSRDLIPEKSILLDNGFDELSGVAWNKGCYVGQELTARTKYRGLVKKRLLPVQVTGPLPVAGTIVNRDGADVGEIRSGHDDLALALIRLDALSGEVPLLCGGATLAPMPPSWINLPRTEGDMPTNG
ncbi:MAG: CAF17-like 4Fe-4S cluster assembly/insertion protein YgfZ [Niveispirillum sp.]|uniref:CAF17-like 4Fe-4S cluster assembly/insertion protein YgfZ n=1 Tax=Niveispirillum sp. TaxID=1917217 RepID=UPI004035910D